MSNEGKYWDSTPFIPMGGITTAISGQSLDQSMRPDLYPLSTSMTPDSLIKYRNTRHLIPGIKQVHYGIYDDPRDYEDLVHGVPSKSSDHVPDCIKGSNLNGNKYFMNLIAESQYPSAKREPLGKSIVRNYKFPEEVKNVNFRFGIPTSGITSAKDIIYNGSLLEEPPDVKKLYNKTHGVTDPGEQQTRNYKWMFDPKNHLFGYFTDKELDGVKKSLCTDNLYNPYPKTKLVEKRLEDFREATEDLLGKSKYYGTLHPSLTALTDSYVFGKKSQLGDAWNAGRCIHGDPSTVTEQTVAPDIDLGRDYHYASRLKVLRPSERDPNRIYGIPSIRTDLMKKEVKSVTDMKNYGDEPDVYELLYPHPCHIRDVHDEDFDVLYTKDEIYALMKKYDFDIPEEEYNLIYQVGLKNYPNEEGKMSPKSFISTMRILKREHQKYRSLVKAVC